MRFRRPHAAANCKRNKDLVGNTSHNIEQNIASLGRCSDIEEGQLIRTLFVIPLPLLYGIASINE